MIENKIRFTGISTPFGGISWEYVENKSHKNETGKELRDILRELYVMRNKLVRSYYIFEYEIEINEDLILEGEKLTDYYEFIVDQYEQIGELLFKSKYFCLLSSRNRQQIVESFDFVIQNDEYLNADPGVNSLNNVREVRPMIEDLLALFKQINKSIDKASQYLDENC